MSSTQTSESIGMTTLSQKDTPPTPSARNNCAPIAITTSHASEFYNTSGKKMTRLHTLHENASLLQKNAGPSTTSTPHQTLLNQSSSLSLPLSLSRPPTHLEFPHLNSLKPVPAPQPHHSISDVTAGCTHARRPLQRLFRPYPKPTPHLHPYPCLHLNNPYYKIRSMFDTSTNP